jgi:hypothetical protein
LDAGVVLLFPTSPSLSFLGCMVFEVFSTELSESVLWIWASELDLDLSLEFTPGGFIFLDGLVSSFVGLPIPNYWTTIYLKYFPY